MEARWGRGAGAAGGRGQRGCALDASAERCEVTAFGGAGVAWVRAGKLVEVLHTEPQPAEWAVQPRDHVMVVSGAVAAHLRAVGVGPLPPDLATCQPIAWAQCVTTSARRLALAVHWGPPGTLMLHVVLIDAPMSASPFKTLPDILDLVRAKSAPDRAVASLFDLCRKRARSKLWATLPAVDVEADIDGLATWLGRCLKPSGTGVYLGLDTLNMRDGAGFNLEFGLSSAADPSDSSTDWLFEGLSDRTDYLIAGLVPLKEAYSKFPEDLAEFADYVVFLGYTGIVLGAAIDRLPPKTRAGRKGRLFVWGFHDGDLFRLIKTTATRTQRIVRE